jgi:hypothetical protein
MFNISSYPCSEGAQRVALRRQHAMSRFFYCLGAKYSTNIAVFLRKSVIFKELLTKTHNYHKKHANIATWRP